MLRENNTLIQTNFNSIVNSQIHLSRIFLELTIPKELINTEGEFFFFKKSAMNKDTTDSKSINPNVNTSPKKVRKINKNTRNEVIEDKKQINPNDFAKDLSYEFNQNKNDINKTLKNETTDLKLNVTNNVNNSIGTVNNNNNHVTKNIFGFQHNPQNYMNYQINAQQRLMQAANNINHSNFQPFNNIPLHLSQNTLMLKNPMFQTFCPPVNNPLANINLNQNNALRLIPNQVNPNFIYKNFNNQHQNNRLFNSVSSTDKSLNNTVNTSNNISCYINKNCGNTYNNIVSENNSTDHNTYISSFNNPQSMMNTLSNNYLSQNPLNGTYGLNYNKSNFIENPSNICQSIYINNSLSSFNSSKLINSQNNKSINNNSKSFSVNNLGNFFI